jgi:AraC-like DNA-binding protein
MRELASADPALRDVLRSVNLRSSVMSRAILRAPFAVRSEPLPRAVFHAVVEGSCMMELDGHPAALEVGPGDVVLLTHGDGHVFCRGDALTSNIAHLPHHDDGTCVTTLIHGGDGEEIKVICGTFEMQHAASDVMFTSLPAHLHAKGKRGPGVGAWLETSIQMLAQELDKNAPNAEATVAKLTDVLVMHLLRACIEQAPDRGGGWLSALRDARIGKAIATMHRDPSGNWTATELARTAGMSRSSFFARFSELVGEPPAKYLARWRVSVAADLMARESLSMGELAERVGYASEDAFSKVFKRVMGVSPGEFRRQAR